MDCTFLVNSCDAYSDLWEPYFKLLEIHWPGCPFPIVLSTESKTFSHERFDIKTYSLHPAGSNIPWGKMTIDILNRINTKFVLTTQEDLFLKAPPIMSRLAECFRHMEGNPSISAFYLYRSTMESINDGIYKNFEKVIIDQCYPLRCNMALWRKDRLTKYISPNDRTPWEFEDNGPDRLKGCSDVFYVPASGYDIFSYDKGGVLFVGKWRRKAIKSLNKKYRLGIDFSVRGFYPFLRTKIFNIMVEALKITGTYKFVRWFFRKIKTILQQDKRLFEE